MIVDMHAHVFTREALAEVDKKIKRYAPQLIVESGKYFIVTGERSTGLLELIPGVDDVDGRLRAMDEAGVDVQVISVTPGNFCYKAPPDAGAVISAVQNDAIADMVGDYPGRFVGCATVPLQDPGAAVEEVKPLRTGPGVHECRDRVERGGEEPRLTGADALLL